MTRVQTLDKTVCISHCTNTLDKGMNLTILHPAMGKLLGRLGSLTMVCQPALEKENSEFKSLKLRLKLSMCAKSCSYGEVTIYLYIHTYIYIYIYTRHDQEGNDIQL